MLKTIKEIAQAILVVIGMVALWSTMVFMVVIALISPIAVVAYVFGKMIGAW